MVDYQGMEDQSIETKEYKSEMRKLSWFLIFFIVFMATLAFVVVVHYKPQLAQSQSKLNDTDFDVIVFVQSWPVTVCGQWMDEDKINECEWPDEFAAWTVQGIWPLKLQTKGPEFCDKSKSFDFNKLSSIEVELEEKWTNIKKNTPLDQLWENEWEKHGTCAAKHIPAMDTELKYFQKGLNFLDTYSVKKLLNKTLVQPGPSVFFKLEEIHDALKISLNKSFAIICDIDKSSQQSLLREVRICFDKSFKMQSCHGILTDDEDPDDEIITNCRKDRFLMYSTDYYSLRQELNTKDDEDAKEAEEEISYTYSNWLSYVISVFKFRVLADKNE